MFTYTIWVQEQILSEYLGIRFHLTTLFKILETCPSASHAVAGRHAAKRGLDCVQRCCATYIYLTRKTTLASWIVQCNLSIKVYSQSSLIAKTTNVSTNDGYMTTCLQPNSFLGSTNRLAVKVRIHWESGKEATLCHSNPQKREESVLQGVVTYMSHVEEYATRNRAIKGLGSKLNQVIKAPFGGWSRDQGDLWTANNQWINNTQLQFNLWPFEN